MPSYNNALNAHINGEIVKAIAAATTAGTVNPTTLGQSVRDALGSDDPNVTLPVTLVENWIHAVIGQGMVLEGKATGGLVRTADCFNITCGATSYCIGSDKIGLFFQQGYMLYEIATTQGYGKAYAEAFNKYTEGLLPRAARRLMTAEDDGQAIVEWLENGSFTFYGFTETSCPAYDNKWGGRVGTIVPRLAQPSKPDNEANRKGMAFYKKLVAGRIDGTTAPFDICDWVNSKWEE